MTNSTLDTAHQVETPEGIDLHAQMAGPVPRVLAYALDLLFRGIVLAIIASVLFSIGDMGMGVFLLISFLLEWFYPVVFELWKKGQTPGKKILGLTVINDNLTPVDLNASVIRNLLRAADFLPFFYLGGLISMAVNKRFQRLGDMAAGTLVIHEKKDKRTHSLPNTTPTPPGIPLDVNDQTALIGFTHRHESLSPERQQELAAILQPLTKKQPQNAVQHLHNIGTWLLGNRP